VTIETLNASSAPASLNPAPISTLPLAVRLCRPYFVDAAYPVAG
jgi:hypothetical protein